MPKGLPQPKDVALGARLRLLRQQRGISQTQLAEQVGVSFQQLQKYEKGENRITYSRLAEAAAALDMTLVDLVAPLDGKSRSVTNVVDYARMLQAPGAMDMLSSFHKLPAAKQRKISALLMALMNAED